tara:strand:- start:247 stop:1023 length:777 start_codon:yes stop_codon:yes gene_type:complete
MTIYISVVSHGHDTLIRELSCLSSLSQDFHIVVKSNLANESFVELTHHENFHWIDHKYNCGFGHNNNIVFEYCRFKCGMTVDDYFIVLNPDIVIASDQIEHLIKDMTLNDIKLSAINLFKDSDSTIYDNSIRTFPSLIQFTKSFLGLGNSSILDKSKVTASMQVDWAAGSFLAFKASHYEELGGFDENYFMYCEDIDICYRSHLIGERVTYFPEIKALHLAKHANRELLSKHFYWHLTSVLRFLFTKVGLTKSKSSLY